MAAPASRILVVDDDPAIYRSVVATLPPRRFEVFFARDGEQGLSEARRVRPHLVLLDIDMPKVDGWTFLARFRSQPEFALVPIIFFADPVEADARIAGFKIGADDFFPKPPDFRELAFRVENALERETRIRTAVNLGATSKEETLSAFKGKLEHVGVSTLLILAEQEQKSGILSLALPQDREKARIVLTEGRPVQAWIIGREKPRDAEAVYHLLTWTSGRFVFNTGIGSSDDRIRMSTQALLLEGARRIDESRGSARP